MKNLSCHSLQFCNNSNACRRLTTPKSFGVAEVDTPQLVWSGLRLSFYPTCGEAVLSRPSRRNPLAGGRPTRSQRPGTKIQTSLGENFSRFVEHMAIGRLRFARNVKGVPSENPEKFVLPFITIL